jgi:hypothetical protein
LLANTKDFKHQRQSPVVSRQDNAYMAIPPNTIPCQEKLHTASSTRFGTGYCLYTRYLKSQRVSTAKSTGREDRRPATIQHGRALHKTSFDEVEAKTFQANWLYCPWLKAPLYQTPIRKRRSGLAVYPVNRTPVRVATEPLHDGRRDIYAQPRPRRLTLQLSETFDGDWCWLAS